MLPLQHPSPVSALPTAQAEVFEEVATMDHPFEGIPTVPPPRDVSRLAFFCEGCRYLVTGQPDWTVAQVGERLAGKGGRVCGGGVWAGAAEAAERVVPPLRRRRARRSSRRCGRGASRAPTSRPAPAPRPACSPGRTWWVPLCPEAGWARGETPAECCRWRQPQVSVEALRLAPRPHCACGPPPPTWQELLYAMQRMENGRTLADYHVPPVSGGTHRRGGATR